MTARRLLALFAGLFAVGLIVAGCTRAPSPSPSPSETGGGTGVLGEAPSPSPSSTPAASPSASPGPGITLEVVDIDDGLLTDSITIKLSNSTAVDQSWTAVRLVTRGIILGIGVGGAGDVIRYETVNGNHCVFPVTREVATLAPGATLQIGLSQRGAGSFTGAELDAAACTGSAQLAMR